MTYFLEECDKCDDSRERCKMELYIATGIYHFTEGLFLSVTPKKDTEENRYSEEKIEDF